MYRLANGFATHRFVFAVTVVGCGGTGGFAAEGICRLLPPHATLVLVDHDRVEERNLGRQNFAREELGRFKSEALAERLARRYGRPVAYTVLPAAMAEFRQGLAIGCVDNGPARRDIAQRVGAPAYPDLWWVDAGNGENYGQVLIGNRHTRHLGGSFNQEAGQEAGVCHALPLPTQQRPELLAQRRREPGCAAAVEAGEQGPTINQAMAALVVEVVRRLIEGTCPWMQLYLDLEAGTLVPVLATPEAVEQMTGIRKRKLLAERR